MHQSDTLKILAQLQRKSGFETKLCTQGISAQSPSWYVKRQVLQYESIDNLLKEIGNNSFWCIMNHESAQRLQKRIEQANGNMERRTVLDSIISIEEPPVDVRGPKVVLVIK